MAILTDAVSRGRTTDTSLTFSHTCTGTNLILFVTTYGAVGSDNITGVTYNTVALTKLHAQQVPGGGRYNTLWYLVAPATGANDVVVTASSSSLISGISSSYTGALQASPIDVSGPSSASSAAAHSDSLTSTVDNGWMISCTLDDNGGGQTAGAGTTLRHTGIGGEHFIYDSNAAITPAGAKTLNYNASSGSYNWASVAAIFKPAVATRKSLTLLGVS